MINRNELEQVLRKYPEVYRHSCSVRDLATGFVSYLGYPYPERKKISLGAYIHDVGKSFIQANILLKAGRLTPEEFDVVKTHTSVGHEYLQDSDISLDGDLMAMVMQHHERVDGSGYPLGLKENQIHPYAKIISLCDVYDAITSKRCYKSALTSTHALHEIEQGLGTQFDQELGEQFIEFIRNGFNSVESESNRMSV